MEAENSLHQSHQHPDLHVCQPRTTCIPEPGSSYLQGLSANGQSSLKASGTQGSAPPLPCIFCKHILHTLYKSCTIRTRVLSPLPCFSSLLRGGLCIFPFPNKSPAWCVLHGVVWFLWHSLAPIIKVLFHCKTLSLRLPVS